MVDKFIKRIERLTETDSDYAQDMEDAYGDSYKNPAYMERMYDLADMEKKRSRGE